MFTNEQYAAVPLKEFVAPFLQSLKDMTYQDGKTLDKAFWKGQAALWKFCSLTSIRNYDGNPPVLVLTRKLLKLVVQIIF